MKYISLLLLFLLELVSAPVTGQPQTIQDSLLNKLTGKWVLQGTIAGAPTTHDVVAEWILGNQYLQITEVSREKDQNGQPSYAAKVFITWNRTSKQYDCLWLDNTGNEGLKDGAAGHAEFQKDKLQFVFIISDNSKFHTTFIYDKPSHSWQWLMDSEEHNNLQPFARLKMTTLEK